MIRSFVAIELPAPIKEKLAALQQELKKSGADVKWVEPQNIHLTLKFIGEQDEQTVAAVAGELEIIAAGTMPYRLSLSGLGAFPQAGSPRIIWAGTDQGTGQTQALANAIEERLCRLGIAKEERGFQSHITIGRVKSSAGIGRLRHMLALLQKKSQEPILGFEVKKLTLFKSTLSAAGPFYEPIKEVTLSAT